MINLRHVVATRGATIVLRDVSVEIKPCEWISLGGPPGSGKTTLLHLLAGWLEPQSGAVVVGDETQPAGSLQLRRVVSYAGIEVPAGYGLRTDEYLHFMARVRRTRVAHVSVTTRLRQLGVDPRAPIETLSQPDAAAVAIAAALTAGAAVTLIDGALDRIEPANRPPFISWLQETRARGAATVIATTDRELAGLCDRHLSLANGRLFAETIAAEPEPRLRAAEVG